MPFEGVQGVFRVSPPIPSGDPTISINMFCRAVLLFLPIKRRLGRLTRRGTRRALGLHSAVAAAPLTEVI
jgi:hypothetical protein